MLAAVSRLIAASERIAAILLAAVTAITFLSVMLRYGFSASIPDGFDIANNLMGILIFWGIAATSFRGEHIAVDLLWDAMSPRGRRAIDLFATTVTLGCLAVFAWMLLLKVLDSRASGIGTYDLRLPVWVFHGLAWLGIALSVPLVAGRLVALFRGEAAIERLAPPMD